MDLGAQTAETDNFFGVYLLVSESDVPKFKGKVYIGYTVNPNRRIRQHNRGKEAGGANKTNNRGPWRMVLIIHGFPNNISALRFEWAWQYPKLSRRLKQIVLLAKRKPNETFFNYNFRILSEMLRIGPWNRLALSIRWLANNYVKDFEPDKLPPLHMNICFGHIKIKKRSIKNELTELQSHTDSPLLASCGICSRFIFNDDDKLKCLNLKCSLICHIFCLADYFLKDNPGYYIPVQGQCPDCLKNMRWHDLILMKENKIYDLYQCDEEESGESEIEPISDSDTNSAICLGEYD